MSVNGGSLSFASFLPPVMKKISNAFSGLIMAKLWVPHIGKRLLTFLFETPIVPLWSTKTFFHLENSCYGFAV